MANKAKNLKEIMAEHFINANDWPRDYAFAAQDSKGDVFLYKLPPSLNYARTAWRPSANHSEFEFMTHLPLARDWKKGAIHRSEIVAKEAL